MAAAALVRYIWAHPLTRHSRLKALSRMLRWQIASRVLPEASVALPFVNGAMLLTRRGMTGSTGNWYCGLDEVDDMAFIAHVLRANDLFVDIGANVGSYSILAAAGCRAEVVAVEPVSSTHAALVANIRLNGLEHCIDAHRLGLADKPGVLRFSDDHGSVNHVLSPGEAGPSEEVPVTTLDLLLAARPSQRGPVVAKIDVEGFEFAVLGGASGMLAQSTLRAVVLETNGSGRRYGWTDDAVAFLLQQHGFVPCKYEALSRRLVRRDEIAQDGNTIFARDIDSINSLVREAPSINLVTGRL